MPDEIVANPRDADAMLNADSAFVPFDDTPSNQLSKPPHAFLPPPCCSDDLTHQSGHAIVAITLPLRGGLSRSCCGGGSRQCWRFTR